MFTATEILDIALQIERNGKAAYRRGARDATHPEIAQRLSWMADEEDRHADFFRQVRADLDENKQASAMDTIPGETLRSVIGDQSFTLEDIDFSEVDNLLHLIDVLIEFENDGILFYELLRTFIKDTDTLASLDQIIAEEYRHVEMLQEVVLLASSP